MAISASYVFEKKANYILIICKSIKCFRERMTDTIKVECGMYNLTIRRNYEDRQYASIIVSTLLQASVYTYRQSKMKVVLKSAKMHDVQWYSYIIHKTVMTLQKNN